MIRATVVSELPVSERFRPSRCHCHPSYPPPIASCVKLLRPRPCARLCSGRCSLFGLRVVRVRVGFVVAARPIPACPPGPGPYLYGHPAVTGMAPICFFVPRPGGPGPRVRVHAAATAHMLCVPIPLRAPLPLPPYLVISLSRAEAAPFPQVLALACLRRCTAAACIGMCFRWILQPGLCLELQYQCSSLRHCHSAP